MNEDKDIESITIPAGKRTYFFDVKLTCKDKKYLTITESKRLGKDEFERHGIMIFEDDINKIVEALRKILLHFPTTKKLDPKSKMEQTKEKYANAYKPWTTEEDSKLTNLFYKGKKTEEISEILQRNKGAINSRIEKLELKQKNR